MQYKRILMSCLIVILMLCTSIVSIGATEEAAPFEVAVEVTSSAALSEERFVLQEGDTFTVSISIDNNPGGALFAIQLNYDSEAVTLKEEYTYGSVYEMGDVIVRFDDETILLDCMDKFTEKNGTIMTFTFEVNEGYHGNTGITLAKASFRDAAYAKLPVEAKVNSAVEVHKYVAEPTVEAANCQHGVITTYTCDTCEDELVLDDGVIGGHTYGDWTVDAAATCTENGVEKQTCIYCDDEATRPIVAGGHAYGDWIVDSEATCTEAGVEKKTCANCGDAQTQATDSLGHDYSTEWTVDLEANCETAGSKSNHCTKCDEKTNVTEIVALGHTYGDWTLDKAATCTEK